ncbi:hypothetical protein C8035_v005017 [Colletotrichum spinosum]|uniref:Uncharacterized protein n=1 Tax=Colletotrichum spinosum TaxID=1347390 RepID=A0A4R8QQI6_9PEZI|nr:hypothetical protein C8035_v005017 [Colletotrichum spinosum]
MSTAAQRGTLAPLPRNHHVGLIVLTTVSLVSFLSTTFLWLFITYKLLIYRRQRRASRRRPGESRREAAIRQQQASMTAAETGTRLFGSRDYRQQQHQQQQQQQQQQQLPHNEPLSSADFPDLSLGLDAPASSLTGFARLEELDRLAAAQEHMNMTDQRASPTPVPADEDEGHRNPFPILIYNLLLADMMEALAYALSMYWVVKDGIYAPSTVCWAQGWLGSTSNLAASLFLSVISVNTFLTVGLGYKPPPWAIYTCIACLWIFDFCINGAGVRVAEADPVVPGESFFMRANVWCWISSSYDPWRLWAHYFWVILSIVLTLSLYSSVFIILWRQKRSCRHMPMKRRSTSDASISGYESTRPVDIPEPSGYHPAFLIYPFVYIACSTPLIIGRITSLLGIDLGIPFFAFAGCVLAANGLFNSILWTTTIIFSAPQDSHDSGLDKFAFIRTPIREYGHSVVISGPASRRVPLPDLASPTSSRKEWWWWKHGGTRPWGRNFNTVREVQPGNAYTTNSVEGPYIQMDVITAVRSEPAESTVSPQPPRL